MPRTTYFDGKPEAFTSYANQRAIAARELGSKTPCVHGVELWRGCDVCRFSGTPVFDPAVLFAASL
jgi:fructosamine-3-kinase